MPDSGARRLRSARRGRSRPWSPDDARAALSRLERSGLALSEFAAREGLDRKRLYRWRAQLRRVPTFVEITPAPAASSRIEVVLRSGHIVRVAEGFGQETLRRLLEILEGGRAC